MTTVTGVAELREAQAMGEVLTSKEAAAYLRISVRTLHRLAQVGGLPGTKVGRAWRFRREDLDSFLSRGTHGSR